jgi:hypothetical protein
MEVKPLYAAVQNSVNMMEVELKIKDATLANASILANAGLKVDVRIKASAAA